MMALAWALGTPARGPWRPAREPGQLFRRLDRRCERSRRGPGRLVCDDRQHLRPPGPAPRAQQLEATLDQSLDEAAGDMENTAAELAASGRHGYLGGL